VFRLSFDMKLFTELDLERLAGRARLERGRSLLDTIDDSYEDEFSLCATVYDRQPYLAMVHHRVGLLCGECECPDGEPGSFCEHSVAIGLYYLSDDDLF
jgi:uncharacterized Zn finger protein